MGTASPQRSEGLTVGLHNLINSLIILSSPSKYSSVIAQRMRRVALSVHLALIAPKSENQQNQKKVQRPRIHEVMVEGTTYDVQMCSLKHEK